MLCPTCNEGKGAVVLTRHYHDEVGQFNYVERKRKCLACGHNHRTIEMGIDVWNKYCNKKAHK